MAEKPGNKKLYLSLSKRLEDFVTCPLCLSLFTCPVSLPRCQHTFCQGCIRDVIQVWQQACIECPACRMGCSIHDIKEDSRAQSLLEIYREAKEEEENALTESEMEGAEPYIPKCEICPSPTHYCEKCQADKCTCPDERLLGNRTQEVGAVGEKKQDKEVASSDKQEMNEKQEVTAASKQEVGVESAVEDKVEVVKQEEDFVQEDVAEKKIKMAEQEVEGGEYVKQEEEEGASLKQEEEVGASLKQEEEAGTIGEEEKREIREQMQALMDKVTQLRQETKRKHELNRQLIKRIEEQELEQIAEVRRQQQLQLEEVDKYHDKLIDEVRANYRGVEKHLETGKKLYAKGKDMLQQKIDMATAAVDSHNIKALDACCQELSEEGMAEVNELNAEMARFNINVRPREFVIEPMEWDPSMGAQLQINPPFNRHKSFERLMGQSFTNEQSIDLGWGCYAEKLCLINDELWCAAYDDGIYVYTKDCAELRVIKTNEMSKVRGVATTEDGEILVACDESVGLIHLNPEGSFKCTITSGSFSDVAYVRETVYGLEHELSKVVAYKLDTDSSQLVLSWECDLGFICDSWDKLLVRDDKIYVSSVKEESIFVFRLEGDTMQAFAKILMITNEGSSRCPILCDVDDTGEALICDFTAQGLMFHTLHQGWQTINLDQELRRPMGVVIDEDLTTLWVVNRNRQMMKFCRK